MEFAPKDCSERRKYLLRMSAELAFMRLHCVTNFMAETCK
jgi:hypothetical protein